MENKKIAIVTKRYNVARFFELEARACGREAVVMTVLPEGISEFSIIISDRNDNKMSDRIEGEITVSVLDADTFREETWTLPIPIGRVRELFCRLGEAQSRTVDYFDGDGQGTIYIADEENRKIFYRNKNIRLSEGEWKILLCLGENENVTVSREKLTSLFGDAEGNVADVYVCTLRRKLEAPFGVKVIQTVRGKGYLLVTKLKNI